MKIFNITKKKTIIISSLIICTLLIFTFSTSFGMQHYYKLDFSTGLVTASTLNVRSGPGTDKYEKFKDIHASFLPILCFFRSKSQHTGCATIVGKYRGKLDARR